MKRTCPRCNKNFETYFPRQKYCCRECRYGQSKCVVCGKEFIKKGNTSGDYCSPECWYKYYGEHGKKEKICPICNKIFHGGMLTCSKECGTKRVLLLNENRNKECEFCGVKLADNVKPKTRFCSRSCSMYARNYSPTGKSCKDGEKRNHGRGYIIIKISGEWLLEHRYVMEQNLGRKLEKHEKVHHKDGNRKNNNINNLELWKIGKKDPPGVRASDYHCVGCMCFGENEPIINKHCPTCTCNYKTNIDAIEYII